MAKELGLDENKIKEISKIKNEPKWMTDFRLNAYKDFKEISNPNFGPELKINFDLIPDELIKHFYRGIFDGDGCISFCDNKP